MTMTTDTTTLRERLGQVADIRSAIALLQWDQEVCMPPKAAPGRSQQLATLSALEHRTFTAPDLGKLLRALRDEADTLAADDAKLVEETLYDYERATRLPESFVEEFAAEQSRAFHVWVRAKEGSDFGMFRPRLDKLVALVKQKADLLGYEGSPYNALLEDHERGMTCETISEIFAHLNIEQTALVKRITDSGAGGDGAWLRRTWDEQAQWDFALRVIQDMGYDLDAGRQDRSAHPFTASFDIHDVRTTTRLDPKDPFPGLMGSIHEAGHALYEQGFQDKDRRTVLAEAPSLGIHESQSRMWENMIGRSIAFWNHYAPLLRQSFHEQLDGVSAEDIYKAANRVRPSLIRVEADECTYNLHVILRFEIETAVVEGRMAVSEIPEAWNAKVRQYLGLEVPDDARGCLQDVHWSHGAFGYFPTYTLGNLYAAQLFEAIDKDVPGLWSTIGRGDFEPLRTWLRTHVHQHGRRMTAAQIVTHATGAEPSAEPYLRYLRTKYGKLYGIQ